MSTTLALARTKSRGSDFELTYASPIILRAKGADNESVLRHERKKRERAFSDEEGKLEADGRKRRHRGSSDDEGNISWDNFVNEDLRVGGPYLCSIPLQIEHIPKTHSLYERLCAPANPIIMRIRAILDAYHINYRDAAFVGKLSRFNPEEVPVVTASIIADRKERDDTWLQASRKIRAYLVEQGLTAVSVEIADPEAFTLNQASPVFKTDAVFSVWDSLRDTILKEIDLTDVRVVGCYRFGKSINPLDNPTTVVIVADTRSIREWKGARELVINILNRFNLPMVAVTVVKDEIHRGGSEDVNLDREVLLGPAKLGQSLGFHNNSLMSGTFGGFIQLKSPKDGKWQAFGITCFHCVVPEEKDLPTFPKPLAEKIRAWYRSGIEVFDATAEKNLLLDHPSLRDMNTKSKYLEDTIKEITSGPKYKEYIQMENEGLADMLPRRDRMNFAALKEELKNTESFAKEIHKFCTQGKHQLGFVVAGSGFKQKPAKSIPNAPFPSNLDWALIRIREGREGINSLGDQGRELNQPNPNHGTDLADRSLYIYGRTSGYSEGKYSDLKDAKVETQLHNGKSVHIITLEHSVTGIRGKQFSQRGDSGALVHDKDGSLVGMIFAGADAHNWSYFTHIADLFDDIQKCTRAAGVRVLDED